MKPSIYFAFKCQNMFFNGHFDADNMQNDYYFFLFLKVFLVHVCAQILIVAFGHDVGVYPAFIQDFRIYMCMSITI